ncbi:MAG: hypothetical protein PHU71_05675 [Candidatus Gracilibacteria bacterium]|nr:hypothetical protein [Candidatus Gracilibacteria bacterium]
MFKSHALIASFLVIIFFLLHYYIYLGNAPTTIPVLQSYTDSPVDLPELSFCEEIRPSYLNPFRKIKYSYKIQIGNTYTDLETGIPIRFYSDNCSIVEEAASIFTSKIQPLAGNPYEYWDSFDEDSFGRPQVSNIYANLIFFIVQYLIIANWITVIYHSIKKK